MGGLSSSANWMLTLAVPVLVWELSESVTLVGTAAALILAMAIAGIGAMKNVTGTSSAVARGVSITPAAE